MYTLDEAFNQMVLILEEHLQLSTSFKIQLREIAHLVYYEKGIKIQHFKQIPDQLWFQISGMAKEIAVNEDSLEEWVTWFWYPNDFLFTEPGLFNKTPADAHIELIEDACLIHISYSDCLKLRQEFPETSTLVKTMRGKYSRFRKQHQVFISNQNIKSRFENLRLKKGALFKIARHKDILEFLGSTDDTFRRFL